MEDSIDESKLDEDFDEGNDDGTDPTGHGSGRQRVHRSLPRVKAILQDEVVS
jgi:hypothetical protein